jgi:polyisoprenoid-binding protein YceI
MKKFAILSLAALFTVALMASEKEVSGEKSVSTEQSQVKWLGKKVGGEHWGYINVKEGSISVEDGKLTAGKIVIDMTTITCEDLEDEGWNKKLVDHLNSDDFFSVDKYASAKFKTTKIEDKGDGMFKVTGDLTIKGKTAANSFDVKLVEKEGMYHAEGTIVFDRSKYDVRYGSNSFFDNLGDKAISDDVELTFKIAAK